MDWFENITGFKEDGYENTRAKLRIEGGRLLSSHSRNAFGVGTLSLPSLNELRQRAAACAAPGRPRVSLRVGDVRSMHSSPDFAHALFQVASQLNCLEMVGPSVTPERGVTRYAMDNTQGPACAMAAGAGTIFRNYFAEVRAPDGTTQIGQTAALQIDAAADFRAHLARIMSATPESLWEVSNGYALPSMASATRIKANLLALDEVQTDDLRGTLRIGLHEDVEVTDPAAPAGQLVSQAYCSAMPIAYSSVPLTLWDPLAKVVLEAAYEATLLAAICNAARHPGAPVLLTRLGGGAFGNPAAWIDAAIDRAVRSVSDWDLSIVMVVFGRTVQHDVQLASEWP